MFNGLDENAIRNLCREKIEALEFWLRRVVHEKFSTKYGEDYINYKDNKGNALFNNSMKRAFENRLSREPDRYKKTIDACNFGELKSLICRDFVYKECFRNALESAFPVGREMCLVVMEKIEGVRNKLSHANTISIRQAEQVMCYSNDIIDSIKTYYEMLGQEQEYIVPKIIQVTDSFGNTNDSSDAKWFDFVDQPECYLRPGDEISIEVLVDPSFPESEYEIRWTYSGNRMLAEKVKGKRFTLKINESNVRNRFCIECEVESNKNWHHHGHYDDSVECIYKVLPPLS